MKMVLVHNSSNIAAIGYDKPSQTLRVAFVSGGVYQYEKVPAVLHMQFMAARSKGQYHARYIKNNPAFPYKELEVWEQNELQQTEDQVHRTDEIQPKFVNVTIENVDEQIKKTLEAKKNVGIIPEEKLRGNNQG